MAAFSLIVEVSSYKFADDVVGVPNKELTKSSTDCFSNDKVESYTINVV